MAQFATRFPDVSKGDAAVLRQFDFYRDNVVLDVVAEGAAFARHGAPLSVKTVLTGEESYWFDGAHFPVAPGRLLVLNAKQEYASAIEPALPARSFCVFFSNVHAATAAGSAGLKEGALLEASGGIASGVPELRPAVLSDEGAPGQALARLRAAAAERPPDPMRLDELCLELLHELIRADRRTAARAERIDCLKKSVREEVLRRLERAAAYARCHLQETLTIDRLAGVACMAPHHFIRRFGEAYGCPPHQYVTRLRMETAARLLRRTDTPVCAVSLNVGYASPGAFAREFRRRTGLSPSAYRAAHSG